MKIFHSKNYQHVQVEEIEYDQYEAICDQIYVIMPTRIISSQYRKNLKTGFFVLMNLAVTNKILKLFANPPPTKKKGGKKKAT